MNPIRWWHNHTRTKHIKCTFYNIHCKTSCGHCWYPLAWLVTYQHITLAIHIHIMPMKYINGCVVFCLCYNLVLRTFTWCICSHSLAFYHCNRGNCTEMYSWFCKLSVQFMINFHSQTWVNRSYESTWNNDKTTTNKAPPCSYFVWHTVDWMDNVWCWYVEHCDMEMLYSLLAPWWGESTGGLPSQNASYAEP